MLKDKPIDFVLWGGGGVDEIGELLVLKRVYWKMEKMLPKIDQENLKLAQKSLFCSPSPPLPPTKIRWAIPCSIRNKLFCGDLLQVENN